MEKRILIVMMLAVAATTDIYAQSDDFGLWAEANVEKKLSKRFTLDGGAEWRLRDDVSETDRWSLGVGATYKLTDWLKASAGYSLLYDNNDKLNSSGKKQAQYWGERHRLNASLTFGTSMGRLSLSLRERYQFTYRPEKTVERYWTDLGKYPGELADEHTYASKSKHLWRNRLQLKYKATKMWRPYGSAESFVGKGGLDKMRYQLGTEIRLSKHHWLDAKYIYQHVDKDDDNEGNKHVIGLGYTYKF